MIRWVRVATEEELWPGVVHPVELPRDERGRPREALVLLEHTGALRAYLNRCQHIPIPLDGGSRDFLDEDGHLRCGTHGALYRWEDGYCFVGPCAGEYLLTLPLRVEAGVIEVGIDDPAPAS